MSLGLSFGGSRFFGSLTKVTMVVVIVMVIVIVTVMLLVMVV